MGEQVWRLCGCHTACRCLSSDIRCQGLRELGKHCCTGPASAAKLSRSQVCSSFIAVCPLAVHDMSLYETYCASLLCDLRRFFATALGKADLAALLRSPSAPVQLAVLRASNALSQHVETLPTASLPWIVRLLQGPDGMFAQQQSAKE
jgi:hypothetical protein